MGRAGVFPALLVCLAPAIQAGPMQRIYNRLRARNFSPPPPPRCRARGQLGVLSYKAATLANLGMTDTSAINLSTHKVCSEDSCSSLIAVECKPNSAAVKCTADAKNNIGNYNDGKNNYGTSNTGNGNIGERVIHVAWAWLCACPGSGVSFPSGGAATHCPTPRVNSLQVC